MATINLGNIKFNWKGTYAGGTAYVVDDVVSYLGSSYICKLASTGNLPTNGTYWDTMAEGGDVATTLTTQGDVLYRDGSGLQRLAAGTNGQFLKTQGTGANPVWATNTAGVAQVVMGEKLDTTVANSSFYTAIPNLSATITPSSTSSKILVDCRLSLTGQHGDGMGSQIQRSIGGGGYSAIGIADANGSRRRSSFSGSAYTGDGSGTDTVQIPVNTIYLDSPNTTSAITYKAYVGSNGGNHFGINISCDSSGTQQGNSSDAIVMTSRIILMEITV